MAAGRASTGWRNSLTLIEDSCPELIFDRLELVSLVFRARRQRHRDVLFEVDMKFVVRFVAVVVKTETPIEPRLISLRIERTGPVKGRLDKMVEVIVHGNRPTGWR
jgi:hypothetical protein